MGGWWVDGWVVSVKHGKSSVRNSVIKTKFKNI